MDITSLLGFAALVAVLIAQIGFRWSQDRKLIRRSSKTADALLPLSNLSPRVSVLVAAWNESGLLREHIESFQSLRYPNRELILCAGGSDGTYVLAMEHRSACVIVIEQTPGQGKQRSLRKCYEHATGDLVYLTDADCLFDDRSFEATLAPLILDGAQAATGGSKPLNRQMSSPFAVQQWFIDRYVRAHWGPTTDGILGRNAALTREAVEASGAFQYEAPTGTDYVMAKRLLEAGVTIRHAPASQVASEYATDFATYRKQQARWLRNVAMHGLAFGSYREVFSSLTPSLIGLVMLVGTPLALLAGPIPSVLAAAAWLHVILNRVRYVWTGERLTGQPFKSGYMRLPLFVVLDLFVWALVLVDYPFKVIRNRW